MKRKAGWETEGKKGYKSRDTSNEGMPLLIKNALQGSSGGGQGYKWMKGTCKSQINRKILIFFGVNIPQVQEKEEREWVRTALDECIR